STSTGYSSFTSWLSGTSKSGTHLIILDHDPFFTEDHTGPGSTTATGTEIPAAPTATPYSAALSWQTSATSSSERTFNSWETFSTSTNIHTISSTTSSSS